MKAIVYLRTSTHDQNPELQRESCIEFCKGIGLEVVEVVVEQGSAYRLEKIRVGWESVVKRAKKEKLDIVLWRYDRSFRNRAEFFKFMKVMFEVYGTKVYSVTEPSIMSFWDMMGSSHNENPVFNELLSGIFKSIWNFMIQQAGESAEEESRKKSERVKLSVRKEIGMPTKSYKGKKWGRKKIDRDKQIVDLYTSGKNMVQITKEVFYWDKNNNKKFVSLGYVHKVLSFHKLSSNLIQEEDSLIKKEERTN